jgi:hypothetical protein
MASDEVPIHRGKPAYYECPLRKRAADLQNPPIAGVRVPVQVPCRTVWFAEDGESVPDCPYHKCALVKRKWKTGGQQVAELFGAGKVIVHDHSSEMLVLKDRAERRSICLLCMGVIDKGEPRIGFDWQVQPRSTLRGGWFVRRRRYVHRTCLIDVIFDGKPGRGCPGCTVKVQDREFRDYKRYIERQHDR